MKRSTCIIVILLSRAFWVSAQTIPPADAKSASFSLKVSPSAEQFHLGEAIHLEISLTNISDRKIYVRRANRGGAIDCEALVQDESGNSLVQKWQVPRDPSEPKVVYIGDFQVVEVDPGQSIGSSLDLSKVFDLSHPGKYNVWVERNDGASSRVKSNVIAVVINQ